MLDRNNRLHLLLGQYSKTKNLGHMSPTEVMRHVLTNNQQRLQSKNTCISEDTFHELFEFTLSLLPPDKQAELNHHSLLKNANSESDDELRYAGHMLKLECDNERYYSRFKMAAKALETTISDITAFSDYIADYLKNYHEISDKKISTLVEELRGQPIARVIIFLAMAEHSHLDHMSLIKKIETADNIYLMYQEFLDAHHHKDNSRGGCKLF